MRLKTTFALFSFLAAALSMGKGGSLTSDVRPRKLMRHVRRVATSRPISPLHNERPSRMDAAQSGEAGALQAQSFMTVGAHAELRPHPRDHITRGTSPIHHIENVVPSSAQEDEWEQGLVEEDVAEEEVAAEGDHTLWTTGDEVGPVKQAKAMPLRSYQEGRCLTYDNDNKAAVTVCDENTPEPKLRWYTHSKEKSATGQMIFRLTTQNFETTPAGSSVACLGDDDGGTAIEMKTACGAQNAFAYFFWNDSDNLVIYHRRRSGGADKCVYWDEATAQAAQVKSAPCVSSNDRFKWYFNLSAACRRRRTFGTC